MFAALTPAEFAMAMMAPATLVYLVLLFLTFLLSKSLERSLIVCGLLTGVFAVWYSLTTAETALQLRAGPAGVSLGADATGILGRIAVLLILSGLAALVLNSLTDRSPYREERIRE